MILGCECFARTMKVVCFCTFGEAFSLRMPLLFILNNNRRIRLPPYLYCNKRKLCRKSQTKQKAFFPSQLKSPDSLKGTPTII